MGDAKVKTEIANPVIPKPTVPDKVKNSRVESQVGKAPPAGVTSVRETPPEQLLDKGAKGIITIYLFDNAPYQCDFKGKIVGDDINVAWRAMYKEYKLWKHTLSKIGGK